MYVKRFAEPEMKAELPSGRAIAENLWFSEDVRLVRATCEPGFRWTEDLQPMLGGTRCRAAHLGVVIEGTYHYELDDGTSFDVGPGEVYDIPAGIPHDEWVAGDIRCVTIDVHAEEDDPYKRPPSQ